MTSPRIGILLAGGASRRFGTPKAFKKWHGQYFYEYVYQALAQTTDEVVISTRQPYVSRFPKAYQTVVDHDDYDGKGPLAAIYSVMTRYQAESYLVLPCDMPFVTANILKKLYDKHQASNQLMTLVEVDGHYQPLMSVWSKDAKSIIKRQLDQEAYAMKAIYDKLTYQVIQSKTLEANSNLFQNINTASQWKETLKWYKS